MLLDGALPANDRLPLVALEIIKSLATGLDLNVLSTSPHSVCSTCSRENSWREPDHARPITFTKFARLRMRLAACRNLLARFPALKPPPALKCAVIDLRQFCRRQGHAYKHFDCTCD